jgi:hypothetical protein
MIAAKIFIGHSPKTSPIRAQPSNMSLSFEAEVEANCLTSREEEIQEYFRFEGLRRGVDSQVELVEAQR